METRLKIDIGRTNIVQVGLGFDVSGDIITSEIRTTPGTDSILIATWNVAFLNDGSDGELILTLDDSVTSGIVQSGGYMDFKRISGGEPLSLFDGVLEVIFRETVTA